jgi:apolipoprotein N-acyltransferase
MPSPPDAPAKPVPLCVDLDGTLIKTDLLWESLARLLRRNPLQLVPVLLWWLRGRAYLKRQLVRRVALDPDALPYHDPFLTFLWEQKAAGRKLVLVTASDRDMALPVARHVGLFDEVLGSDGKTNLRSANKLKALVEKFGERGFDYAGNSSADFAVWRGAREAIVVNASAAVLKRAGECARLGPTFTDGYSPLAILKRFLNELLIRSGYLLAAGAGLLLAAAFPKIAFAGCAWVAPALLLAAAHGKGRGDAFRVGYVAGLAHFLSSLYWLLLIPVPGFPILGWAALSAYLALYPAAWTWLVSQCAGLRIASPRQGVRQASHGFAPARSASALRPEKTVTAEGKAGESDSWSGRLLWSLGGAAAWVALEMVRARLLSGFPWNPLGASQYHMIPLIQIAAVTGVYGVSFLVVWFSLSLFSAVRMLLQRPASRVGWQVEILLPLAVVTVVYAIGFARLDWQPPAGATLRVTLVQPSIPQALIWDPAANTNRFRQLLELSERALTSAKQTSETLSPNGRADLPVGPDARQRVPTGFEGRDVTSGTKTDLLVWPESAVPVLSEANVIAVTNLIRKHQVWLIFNAEDARWRAEAKTRDDIDYFNAAFLFGPDGRFRDVYHKQNLVIFGEYIPLVRWLPFIKWFTPITGSFASGTNAVPFVLERRAPPRPDVIESSQRAGTVPGVPDRVVISTLICFEDVFPHLAREYVQDDTDFLVNLTNDGWFGEGAAQWQQAATAVFRAVENGVPLVRGCNNGLTCWADATGRLREIFKDPAGSIYGPGFMTIEIPVGIKREPTFYNRHGDWFGWGCVGLTVILLVVTVTQKKRRVLPTS